MNPNFSLQNMLNEIMVADYVDAIDILIYSLKKHIRKDYIEENEDVEKLTLDISRIIKRIIEKTIKEFGDLPNIVRYCLKKYFNDGRKFTSNDLYKKINNKFFFSEKKKIGKALSNEYSKSRENSKVARVERGKYYVNIPYE